MHIASYIGSLLIYYINSCRNDREEERTTPGHGSYLFDNPKRKVDKRINERFPITTSDTIQSSPCLFYRRYIRWISNNPFSKLLLFLSHFWSLTFATKYVLIIEDCWALLTLFQLVLTSYLTIYRNLMPPSALLH